jgi:hypothetical protein
MKESTTHEFRTCTTFNKEVVDKDSKEEKAMELDKDPSTKMIAHAKGRGKIGFFKK